MLAVSEVIPKAVELEVTDRDRCRHKPKKCVPAQSRFHKTDPRYQRGWMLPKFFVIDNGQAYDYQTNDRKKSQCSIDGLLNRRLLLKARFAIHHIGTEHLHFCKVVRNWVVILVDDGVSNCVGYVLEPEDSGPDDMIT